MRLRSDVCFAARPRLGLGFGELRCEWHLMNARSRPGRRSTRCPMRAWSSRHVTLSLHEALRALPPRRRLVFFLRYFADLSYEEIAAACGISEGTVAAALAQARAAVAEALGEEVRK